METGYLIFRPIKRTVLVGLPLGLHDTQALPPRSWCEACGAEVYRPGQRLCSRCTALQRHMI